MIMRWSGQLAQMEGMRYEYNSQTTWRGHSICGHLHMYGSI